jgi:hypothetical protein
MNEPILFTFPKTIKWNDSPIGSTLIHPVILTTRDGWTWTISHKKGDSRVDWARLPKTWQLT